MADDSTRHLRQTHDSDEGGEKLLESEAEEVVFDALFPLAVRSQEEAPAWPAAVLLWRRKPKCRKSCIQAVRDLLDGWDVSIEEVPFYLVSQFGVAPVREAISNLRDTGLTPFQLSSLETVEYWVATWEIWDVGNPNAESIELNRAKRDYPDLFKAVTDAMIRQDPIGIYRGRKASECEAAATVVPRLNKCLSEADVVTVLHQEFSKWFDWKRAGERARYTDLASEIWKLWTETKSKPATPQDGPPGPSGNSGATEGPPSGGR